MKGKKTGGRIAGTPNKLTKQVKSELQNVFDNVLYSLDEMILTRN